jgi:hypothetical protein
MFSTNCGTIYDKIYIHRAWTTRILAKGRRKADRENGFLKERSSVHFCSTSSIPGGGGQTSQGG